MKLGPAHTRTVHRHGVSIRVEDGPILTSQLSRHAPERQFRVDVLRLNYDEGELTSAEVSGVRINADGSEHRRSQPATINYVDRDLNLRADTPEWVRQAVRDNPWPADPWPAAVASTGA